MEPGRGLGEFRGTGAPNSNGDSTSGTTVPLVSPYNWVYYENGSDTTTASTACPPAAEPSPRPARLTFQLQPYAGNNAVMNSGDLTLTAPAKCTKLNLLTVRRLHERRDVELHAAFRRRFEHVGHHRQPHLVDGIHRNHRLRCREFRTANVCTLCPNSTSDYWVSATLHARLAQADISLSAADQLRNLTSIDFSRGGTASIWVMGLSNSTTGLVAAQAYANNVEVTADSTIDVTNSLAASLGDLTIDAHKLSLTGTNGAN